MKPHTIDELERLNALEVQYTRDLCLELSPAGRWLIEQALKSVKRDLEKIWEELDGGL